MPKVLMNFKTAGRDTWGEVRVEATGEGRWGWLRHEASIKKNGDF